MNTSPITNPPSHSSDSLNNELFSLISRQHSTTQLDSQSMIPPRQRIDSGDNISDEDGLSNQPTQPEDQQTMLQQIILRISQIEKMIKAKKTFENEEETAPLVSRDNHATKSPFASEDSEAPSAVSDAGTGAESKKENHDGDENEGSLPEDAHSMLMVFPVASGPFNTGLTSS